MAAILKLITFSICLNIFLYLGCNYAVYGVLPPDQRPDMPDDLFSILLSDREGLINATDHYANAVRNGSNYSTAYKFNPSGNFSNIPDERSGASIEITQGGFSFIDVARMVLPFLRTMVRVAFMPLYLFSFNLFPPTVGIIIALPLFLLNMVAYISFLRGTSQ